MPARTENMTVSQIHKTDPIIIVGAGVFGLSTALHLAQRGYEDVRVFDSNPYEETRYDYSAGCDSASAGTFADRNLLFSWLNQA